MFRGKNTKEVCMICHAGRSAQGRDYDPKNPLTTKRCHECKRTLPRDQFYRSKYGYGVACKECFQNKMKKYQRNETRRKFYGVVAKARKKGIPCDTTKELKNWYERQPMTCYYCERPLGETTHSMSLATLDRLVPENGYVEENIVLACLRCNIIKGNWFTPNEMKEIAQVYELEHRWTNRSNQDKAEEEQNE